MKRRISIALMAALLSGCIATSRDGFTALERSSASPSGFPLVRYAPGDAAGIAAIHAGMAPRPARHPMTMLALSGGGANGAYGAGVLLGWTETGKRPEFSVVTGVSTGALIAPFAFLGPAWDDELKSAFTDGRASRLLTTRGLRTLSKGSVYSGRPLRRLAESYVSEPMMAAIAAEHERGRELLIATADLDSQRTVLWDMGAIAGHGGPAARDLFIQVLVASASIPGVFPPAMIQADAGGRTIREMHADGSMINAFYVLPEDALLTLDGAPGRGGSIHILVNGKVDEEFAITRRSLLSVLGRSYDTLTKASWRASLSQVAVFGKRNDIETRVALIPPAAPASALDFSTRSMTALFELGRSRALKGEAWSDLRQRLLNP